MENGKIRILIADDHPIFREGIISIIEKDGKSEVVSSCGDGLEALNKIEELKPDIAILDIDMPKLNALEIVKELNTKNFICKIIILTIYKDEEYFNEAMDLGIKGYLVKDSIANELIECIESVLKGIHYISPVLSEYLITRSDKEKSLLKDKPGLKLLTRTEKNILHLLAENKTSKQIARELFISEKTVQNHRNNISRKLGIKGPHKLLEFALKNEHLL
jgi:DNA-binding NarL/FixJ family response regulator